MKRPLFNLTMPNYAATVLSVLVSGLKKIVWRDCSYWLQCVRIMMMMMVMMMKTVVVMMTLNSSNHISQS